jgi:capsule polysaccharide export protein KpsE/RkpR
MSLRAAIDKGGLAGVDVQSRAILEPSAQLRAQIALREVQLSAIRIFATDQHPDIERLRHEISSMKRELGKLEGGDGKVAPVETNVAGFENLRRFRDMKFLERLAELLTQQFEAAKIDEAKDTSIVQVLDIAVEPERKSWPARTRITLITGVLGLVLGIMLAFVRERIEKARSDSSRASQLTTLWQYLRLK